MTLKRWTIGLPMALALAAATPALAGETKRQLDAHEHGSSTLNIGIEGTTVRMELEAPGFDIVGFEHKAKSKADKKAIKDAKTALGKPASLFQFSADAGCTLKSSDVKHVVEASDGHDDHGHGHNHSKKAKKAKKGHSHSHDHDKEKKASSTHSEFQATYVMTCSSPEKITTLAFPYFKSFAKAEEVEVNIASGAGQKSFEVERDNPKLSLAGVI